MFKLSRSYLLTNIHQGNARILSLKQPYAQLFTEHKATTYEPSQLEQRFDRQAYCQEFGELPTDDHELNRLLAHLDLQQLIAQDQSLADDDFVLIVEEGTLLASNWQEQVSDILEASYYNTTLNQRLKAVSLGDYNEHTFRIYPTEDLEKRRGFVARSENILSLENATYTRQRQQLVPQFKQALAGGELEGINKAGQTFSPENLDLFSSLVSLNRPLELVCVGSLPLHQPCAYLIKVEALRAYIAQLSLASSAAVADNSSPATWHKPLAWNMAMWHKLFDFNIGSIVYTNPSIAVPNYIHGKAQLNLFSHSLISWMQTHQIQASSETLGYDYVEKMPKYVFYQRDQSFTLQQFYNNQNAVDFAPVELVSASKERFALGWSHILTDTTGNNSLNYSGKNMSQTFALFRIFQALLLDEQMRDSDYFILTNSNVKLADSWYSRLNQSLALLANATPENKVVLGDVAGANSFTYLGQGHFSQTGQQYLNDYNVFVLPNSDRLYLQGDYFNESLQSLTQLTARNYSFIVLSKAVIRNYVQLLRQRLAKLTLKELAFNWEVQVGLDTFNEAEFNQEIEKYRGNDYYNILFEADKYAKAEQANTDHTSQGSQSMQADKDLPAQAKQFQEKILALLALDQQNSPALQHKDNSKQSHKQSNKLNKKHAKDKNKIFAKSKDQGVNLEVNQDDQAAQQAKLKRQSAWLEALFAVIDNLASQGKNNLFTYQKQLCDLIDLDGLNDWQVLTLAAPLFEVNIARVTMFMNFTTHSIMQTNPPIAVTQEISTEGRIFNNEQFGIGDYQTLRSNRQHERVKQFYLSNPQAYPDYLAKVRKFVINLPSSSERLQGFLSQNNCQDFEVQEAVYGKELTPEQVHARFDVKRFYHYYERLMTPGEIGCTLSHWEIYQKVLQDDTIADDDWVLVCEDDTKFFPDWYERTNQILHYLENDARRRPHFLQCNNNSLNANERLNVDQIRNVTYFSTTQENIVSLNNKQSLLFPHAVVSYGSSHYLFRKSALRSKLFASIERPYWVADDFPRFFAFVPDSYAYAIPMLSYQDVDNFESLIDEERKTTIAEKRKNLLETELYIPLNFTKDRCIVIQRELSEAEIKEKFSENLRHIIKRAEFDALTDEQLKERYDLESFQNNYKRLPTREEMIRAIMHQEAYKFIDNLVTQVHNYYLVVEDDVTPSSASAKIFVDQVVNYIATRLDTRTEVIELSNTYWSRALAAHDNDPRALAGHRDLEAELEAQGRKLSELEYVDLTKNKFGYAFSDYPIKHENFKDYYVIGNEEQNYHVNPYLDILITSNHANTGAKAYLIFSYLIKSQTLAHKPIAWLHDDFPKFIFYHNLALAYVMPPIYL
ncbi:hypothetical protein CKF54_01180 [Psittacicella hinzii]|uniref:Glycosyl transferase family 25 domain-containing protein n=1 Tax=Psittacicella hinzii TaxID=2028575 RepID=A0A3A1Y9K5_9GAMM|nr:glycosyltransferase family 25 protein [Psittacicella hinzii]RIY34231.1 hypothetical protein CKF54_01180 [Psittacicella hinzii]